MSWLPLALLTALSFGLYNVFIKVGSTRIEQVLGAVVLQVVATLLGAGFLLYLRLTGAPLFASGAGLLYSVLAGACVGLAEILSFVVFARGAPASAGTPIIMGGAVLVATLVGMTLLKEGLSLSRLGGVALIAIGIALASAGSRH